MTKSMVKYGLFLAVAAMVAITVLLGAASEILAMYKMNQGLPGAVSLGIFAFFTVFWAGQKINTIFIDSIKKD